MLFGACVGVYATTYTTREFVRGFGIDKKKPKALCRPTNTLTELPAFACMNMPYVLGNLFPRLVRGGGGEETVEPGEINYRIEVKQRLQVG